MNRTLLSLHFLPLCLGPSQDPPWHPGDGALTWVHQVTPWKQLVSFLLTHQAVIGNVADRTTSQAGKEVDESEEPPHAH